MISVGTIGSRWTLHLSFRGYVHDQSAFAFRALGGWWQVSPGSGDITQFCWDFFNFPLTVQGIGSSLLDTHLYGLLINGGQGAGGACGSQGFWWRTLGRGLGNQVFSWGPEVL